MRLIFLMTVIAGLTACDSSKEPEAAQQAKPLLEGQKKALEQAKGVEQQLRDANSERKALLEDY